MAKESRSKNQTYDRAKQGLINALKGTRSGISLDGKDYVRRFQHNLLPSVWCEDFEDDLHEGDGNELSSKFCAPHSSAALAVNCFAPFRKKLGDLPKLPGQGEAFDSLRFEAKCSTGVGPRDPNLDVLLRNSSSVLGIESKLTEHCEMRSEKKQQKDLSRAKEYVKTMSRERWLNKYDYFQEVEKYFEEMKRLINLNKTYEWLDAMQLIKHAFGLANTYRDFPVTLLYLYWEPENADEVNFLFEGRRRFPFKEHREEIKTFAKWVAGSKPAFEHRSYPALWDEWKENATGWVSKHLCDLESRYRITIPYEKRL